MRKKKSKQTACLGHVGVCQSRTFAPLENEKRDTQGLWDDQTVTSTSYGYITRACMFAQPLVYITRASMFAYPHIYITCTCMFAYPHVYITRACVFAYPHAYPLVLSCCFILRHNFKVDFELFVAEPMQASLEPLILLPPASHRLGHRYTSLLPKVTSSFTRSRISYYLFN